MSSFLGKWSHTPYIYTTIFLGSVFLGSYFGNYIFLFFNLYIYFFIFCAHFFLNYTFIKFLHLFFHEFFQTIYFYFLWFQKIFQPIYFLFFYFQGQTPRSNSWKFWWRIITIYKSWNKFTYWIYRNLIWQELMIAESLSQECSCLFLG